MNRRTSNAFCPQSDWNISSKPHAYNILSVKRFQMTYSPKETRSYTLFWKIFLAIVWKEGVNSNDTKKSFTEILFHFRRRSIMSKKFNVPERFPTKLLQLLLRQCTVVETQSVTSLVLLNWKKTQDVPSVRFDRCQYFFKRYRKLSHS